MKSKAQLILEIIGSPILVALGANQVMERENGVSFKFRGSRNGNFVKIEYTSETELRIELFRVGSKIIKERVEENVPSTLVNKQLQTMLNMKLPGILE